MTVAVLSLLISLMYFCCSGLNRFRSKEALYSNDDIAASVFGRYQGASIFGLDSETVAYQLS